MDSSLTRREFLQNIAIPLGVLSVVGLRANAASENQPSTKQPNILFIMTDQQRFDTIAALGNQHIYTPNMDRLVRRGLTFTNAYSPCPVCVPARYTIRTGCDSPTTRIFSNEKAHLITGQAATMTGRCGPYLAQTMKDMGYRTFGIGKFHTTPWNEQLGFDVHLHSEELYGKPNVRAQDSYAAWIKKEHPAYDFIEMLMGERTEMYYIPQMSATPADVAVEGWAAARACEQLKVQDERPFFGFVSFIGPHPPFAPPIPFNRMYDPDRMPNPIRGDLATDHMDEQIVWMNHAIWADDINDSLARILKARYYGEISYIDDCIGRILDVVEARPDADNTVICFFSDHGDHLGDHTAWQKEGFFDVSCHIPFLVSWPAKLPKDQRRPELVSLTDLFGIATHAAGKPQPREGMDVLGMLSGTVPPREDLFGYHGEPGTDHFKIMVRHAAWKYIHMANGGREQLFNLQDDPHELKNIAAAEPDVTEKLRAKAAAHCNRPELVAALDSANLRQFPFRHWPAERIYQFDSSRGVNGFPQNPADVLKKKK
ncbi:MAG: choline-sulfatase [Verrucomicrobia bacterium]|nr:MAG: choline-sulfatase [Verrucomicrobiota bacterium]